MATLQKIKDFVDQYMMVRPHPRHVYANHIFSAKPPIYIVYPPFPEAKSTQYDAHFGPVTGVATSPFNKRLFLTCSTDGTVRLYDNQEISPVCSFEPGIGEYLNCVEWSLFRPAVFAAVSNTGNLYIYDLVASKKSPVETMRITESEVPKHSERQAIQIVFNPRQRDFVAVGYYDKTVKIFRLGRGLSNMVKDDQKVLKEFLKKEKNL